MNACDNGDFDCGIFVDLHNALDRVDHEIVLK